MSIPAWMPGLRDRPAFNRSVFTADCIGGVTVAAYLVPQCMAYGQLAGVGPIAGLWASIGPGILYAIFGSSRRLSVGPETTTALMTAAAIGPIAQGDGARYVALAAALALLVGVVATIAYIVKLGFVADWLSKPVLIGYLAGVAVMMFGSQLSRVSGASISSDHVLGQFREFLGELDTINWYSFSVALGVFAFLILVSRLWPGFPAPLVAIIGATIAVSALSLVGKGVVVVGEVQAAFPPLGFPSVAWADMLRLLPAAAGIALVGYSDNVLTARAFVEPDHPQPDANQELLAFGINNFSAGLSAGFPVSSSGTRTALAKSAGSRTHFSGLVTVVAVTVVMLVGRPLIARFPTPSLGALVVFAALSLVDMKGFVELGRYRRSELYLALVTVAGVIAFDALSGIALAVALSSAALLGRVARPSWAVLGQVLGLAGFHDVDDWPDSSTIPGLLIVRFDGPLFFANADVFRREIYAAFEAAGPGIEWVVLNAEAIIDMDATAAEKMFEVCDHFDRLGVVFAMARAKMELRELLQRSGLDERFPPDRMFATLPTTVEAFQNRSDGISRSALNDSLTSHGTDEATGEQSA